MSEQREMKGRNPWHRPLTVLVAVISVIAIVTLVTVAVLQNKTLLQKYKFGIVLDAGSSHTAVYIYHWPAEKDNNTGRVMQVDTCKVNGPGISSYASDPWRAGESLKACMQKAQRVVPSSQQRETPLILGATAGMRLLNKENVSASDEVFRAVEAALQKFPFSFKGARILSGQEEGAFGWVTVNYLDDRLNQGQETMGALDLGGASTQISFISNGYDGSESPDNSVTFRLYGNDYTLYTHSFLCYGKDQVLRLALAGRTQTGLGLVSDPCFHLGYSEVRNYSDLYASPCVSERRPAGSATQFIHSGTGDFLQCQEAVKRVFDHTQCDYSRCSFNGVFQPQLKGSFGAFSAYYFVMNFLNLTNTSVPLAVAQGQLAHYCSTPWSDLVQRFPKTKMKYLAEYCFSGTYILTLLTQGYNFTAENYGDIKFIKKIKDSDAGWTLGYMLNLTNMIPAEAPDTLPLPHGGYVSLMIVMTLLLTITLALAVFIRRPRCSKHPQII